MSDFSTMSTEQLLDLYRRTPPAPAPAAPAMTQQDLTGMSTDELMRAYRALPVAEGDWNEVGRRVSDAERRQLDLGPPNVNDVRDVRLQAARAEGTRYGATRGRGETGLRQLANTAGLGLPNLLEAATSGFGSGLSTPETHDFINAADDSRLSRNPISGYAGVAGGVVGQAAAIPLRAAATVGMRIAQSAGLGAGLGGVQAAIESRADPLRTAIGTGVGGAAGAAGGAIVEAAAPLLRPLGDRIANLIQNPANRARELVGRAFQADNIPPSAAQTGVGAHPEAVLADVGGPSVRNVMRGASNLSPVEGHSTIARTLDDRAARETQALREAAEGFGGAQSVAQAQQGIRDAARQPLNDLYRRAYAETPEIADDALIQFLSTPHGSRASGLGMEMANREYAARTLRGEQLVRPEFPVSVGPDGVARVNEGSRVGLEFFDYVKRALDDMVRNAQPGTNDQRTLEAIRSALVRRLDDVAPSYAAARNAAGEAIGARNATEAGALSLSPGRVDARDAADMVARMSPEQRAAFRSGQSAEMTNRLDRAERSTREGGSRSAARSVITPEMERRLGLAANDIPDAAEAFTRQVEFWRAAGDTRAAMGNSSTARQLATTAALTGAPLGADMAYNRSAIPSPQALALSGALLGGRQYALHRQDLLGREIARLLMARNPEIPTEVIQRQADRIAASMARAGAAGGAVAGQQQ